MNRIGESTQRVFAVACVLAMGIVNGCGGGGDDAPTTPTPAAVASVSVSPATATFEVGASTTLTAVIRDSKGLVLTDRTISWTSSAPNRATVSGTGVVTGISVGQSTITATSSGVFGTAIVTVTAPPASLTVFTGNNQRGLVGRPLADSLAAKVISDGGINLANVPVTWTTSGGNLSATSTLTNADGIARVQLSPSDGDVIVTATVQGVVPLTFHAHGRANGLCIAAPSAQTARFSLGPTDPTLSLRATQPLRIAVLFVDFPGLVSTESPAALMSTVVDPGLQMLREMSHGRIDITTVSFPTWFRMPKAITQYDWTTFTGHREYLLDVLSVSNPTIDFSTFDALYVFTPPSANKPISPTFNGGSTANVVADGRNFGNAVTFGQDSRTYGPAILVHETGHMLGLVDLYAYTPAGGTNYPGNQFKYVGAWSIMSNVFNPAHFLTWEKRKLGFITAQQVDCLEGEGGVEEVILPSQPDLQGVKMIAAMLDASSALVVEVRNDQGVDANLCWPGVLIYVVDARIPSGQGAAQVIGSRVNSSGAPFNKCGPWADATFGFGPSPPTTYTHPGANVTVTVLRQELNGAYRVRVKR